MKNYIYLCLLFATPLALADTFVETIAQLSARDAVVVNDDGIFASNYNTGVIYKLSETGQVETVLSSNARGPAGIRFDDQNNMYVAMYNTNSVIKFDPDGNEEAFAQIREPIALDWDTQGNLYVSSFAGATTVSKITPDGNVTEFASIPELTFVSSLCLDSEDNVYVTSYQSADIYRVTPDGIITLFATSDVTGYGFLQFDEANQTFYGTAVGSNALLSFDLNGNGQILIDSTPGGVDDGPIEQASIFSAIGLAVTDDGKHVYFATDNHIRRLNIADPLTDQVRPYFTSEEDVSADVDSEFNHTFSVEDPNADTITLTVEGLPGWLTFDSVDTLNGTPANADADSTATITATANDGTASVTQTLAVSVGAASTPDPAPAPTPAPSPATPSTGDSGGGALNLFALLAIVWVCVKRIYFNSLHTQQ